MTIMEYLHYITVGNPVSSAIINGTYAVFQKNGKNGLKQKVDNGSIGNISESFTIKTVNTKIPLWQMIGHNHNIIRLAALCGASAVILGAVGGHHFNNEKAAMKNVFETANRFHFFHSIALLGMPFAKYPMMSGTLMTMGMVLFCGVLYYRAFTDSKPRLSRLAPIGGSCLIAAWLSLLL